MSSRIQECSPRIVLLAGGCFSPPTFMHLRMFEIARDHLEVTGAGKVIGGIISPTHDSYGKTGLVGAKHRLAMLKLSLRTSNWINLSDWECTQNQWSSTVKSLKYHQNYMNNVLNEANNKNENIPGWLPDNIKGSRDKIHLKLLCGADLLESFSVPGLWAEEDIEDIVGDFGIVVISRSGSNPEKFIFDSDILSKHQANITIVRNWVPNEVSSSVIRRLLKRGQSVKYLIDDYVFSYIQTHKLYDIKSREYYLHNCKRLQSNKNYIIKDYINEFDIKNQNQNSSILEYEEMDETDFKNKSVTDFAHQSSIFCCKDIENSDLKFTLNCPGQAIKIVTNPLQTTQYRNDQQRMIELNKANVKKLKTSEDGDDRSSLRCDNKAV